MKRALLLAPLLAPACATPSQPAVAVRAPVEVRLPPSAVAGAVIVLEALEANRPKDALVEVRALESSSIQGASTPGGLVRVFLHLSVFAQTAERAREAYESLATALETEARTPHALGPVAVERARGVVGGPSWALLGGEDFLSYSGALRIELTPVRASGATAQEAAGHAPPEKIEIEHYVRNLAAAEAIEAPDLSLRASARTPGVTEVRCRIADAPTVAGHARGEIGAFLAALENDSPATRVTEVMLERSPNAIDPHAAKGWALQALLLVRVPDVD